MARRVARLWMIHLLFFSRVRIKTIGKEKLDKNSHYVFVANHQSYYDIPALSAGLPFLLSFIAKKELFRIPLFGWAMSAAGHVWISRDNARAARKSISRAVDRINKGSISLVLFPEGTRSCTDVMGTFKRASFTLAIEAGVPVVPVSIVGARSIMAKRSLSLVPGTVFVVVGDPIPAATVALLDKKELSALMEEKLNAGVEYQLGRKANDKSRLSPAEKAQHLIGAMNADPNAAHGSINRQFPDERCSRSPPCRSCP
jgi:1-acyl-sn-glycerol-3-phosphate acyltransferase